MKDTLLENALSLRRAGRFAEAADLYAQILADEPHHFDALHALATLRFQMGRLEEAERLIGAALTLRPDAADALYNRACLLARMNRTDEALEAFGRVVAVKPGHVQAWTGRAALFLMRRRFGEAISACDHALALKPGDASAQDIRARAVAARPSLSQFENAVAERRLPDALALALRIFHAIDERFGRLDGVEQGKSAPSDAASEAKAFAGRFAPAFLRLIADPDLRLGESEYEWLLVHHRWIDLIASLAGLKAPLPQDARRAAVLRSLNAENALDLDAAWKEDREAIAPALLQYLSSRTVFEPHAFALRERLLRWLPEHLPEAVLSDLSLSRMADAYMHCSYAMTPCKHAIKRPLMEQMRRACLAAGCVETFDAAPLRSRPSIVVVAENLTPGHSVHRTHARAIASLKERFHVTGIVYPDPKGTAIEALFDECLPLAGSNVFDLAAYLSREIRARAPQMMFYVGAGMVPPFVALASLRLAPVQCVSFGHTATTMSPAMDYFVLPEDFVASHDVFSENVLALPRHAMPFTPRPFRKPSRPPPDGTVRVAVPASTMKLNPVLFGALAGIASGARAPHEIHFFPLGASGLAYAALEQSVRAQVPNAHVFPEMSHEAYLERLNACDVFLSPFPYGNMNSIVDAFQLGLPGVCLDGLEAHAHADAAFFARIGLPPVLAAASPEDYIAQAIRLIDDPGWRAECREIVARADLDAAFFTGDARLFCDALAGLI